MIKAILFDLDGVVIKKREKMFSQRLSEQLDLSLDKILTFFNGEFRECSLGRADLREKVAPYLKEWNYKGLIDDFLKFWFESESETNTEVLEIIESLRTRGLKCYIATRQEKYRKEYVWNEMNLKNYFDGIFCTCDIGYEKWQKEYWDFVLKDLKLEPVEIIFFCDGEKNVDCAKNLNINSFLYTDPESLKNNLKNFL